MVLAAFLPMHRGNLQPIALPTSNLTLQFDPSVAGSVWQTVTTGNNPCWSSPAGDGDAVQVTSSIIPGTGSERTLIWRTTSNQSPLYKSASPALRRPDLLFDGSNDALIVYNRVGTSVSAFNSFMSTTAGTILVAFQIHACTLNNGNPVLNSPIFGDSNAVMGVFVRRSSTGPDVHKIQFANCHDGATFNVVEQTISLDTSYVACWRHDATTLYGSINGGVESSIASGSTFNLAGGLCVGGGVASGTIFTNCSIGGILVYNAALTGTALSDARGYMSRWL